MILKLMSAERSGLLSRLRRAPSLESALALTSGGGLAFADDLVSSLEARALWSRFGL